MKRALLLLVLSPLGCGRHHDAAPGIYPTTNPTTNNAEPPSAVAPPSSPQPSGPASLKLTVGGTAPQGTYTITVDGREIAPAGFGNVPVAPGTHKVAYTYVGRFGVHEQIVEVQPGEQKEVELTVMMKH